MQGCKTNSKSRCMSNGCYWDENAYNQKCKSCPSPEFTFCLQASCINEIDVSSSKILNLFVDKANVNNVFGYYFGETTPSNFEEMELIGGIQVSKQNDKLKIDEMGTMNGWTLNNIEESEEYGVPKYKLIFQKGDCAISITFKYDKNNNKIYYIQFSNGQ